MKANEPDIQSSLQARAELAERQNLPAGSDHAVDRYRLVLRALRRPPAAQLPADFAARVAARVRSGEERGSVEDWLVTGLLFGMAAVGLFYVQPVLATVVERLHYDLPPVPWPLLGAAAVSLVLAWAVDRGASGWRGGHRA